MTAIETTEDGKRRVAGFGVRECRSCSAPIIWSRWISSGKAIPLDLEPAADGNVVLTRRGVRPARDGESPRRKSHFATCPNADEHRNPRK